MKRFKTSPKFKEGDRVNIFLENNVRSPLSGSGGHVTEVKRIPDSQQYVYRVDTGKQFGVVSVFQESLVRSKNHGVSDTRYE
jgi:hypothetical protein